MHDTEKTVMLAKLDALQAVVESQAQILKESRFLYPEWAWPMLDRLALRAQQIVAATRWTADSTTGG